MARWRSPLPRASTFAIVLCWLVVCSAPLHADEEGNTYDDEAVTSGEQDYVDDEATGDDSDANGYTPDEDASADDGNDAESQADKGQFDDQQEEALVDDQAAVATSDDTDADADVADGSDATAFEGSDTTPPGRRAALADDPDLDSADLQALDAEWRDDSDDAIPTDTDEDPIDVEWAWQVEEPADAENADLGTVDRRTRIERPFVRRVPDTDDGRADWGGKPVPDTGTPWLATLYAPRRPPVPGVPDWVNHHECGGALIEPNWVLTAAHCVPADPSKWALLRVRVGAEDVSTGDGVDYRIVRAVRHAGYALAQSPAPPNMYRDDIAVVEVALADGEQTPDPRQVQPIGWRAPALTTEALVTASNWYRYADDDEGRERALLLKFEMRVPSLRECREVPGHEASYKLHDGVFCAGHPERMVCRGDSGGPVAATNGRPVVVGIASWGRDTCSVLNEVGVYTRVASYTSWIRRAIDSPADVTTLR